MREIPASEILDIVEYLYRKSNSPYRNLDELINYTQLLEQLFATISEEHGLRPNFNYFHETFCPHWINRLEDNNEQGDL